MININDGEKNLILYYADYISLQHENIPVTDSCKYFFIKGSPYNIEYIVTHDIEVDFDNKYVREAYNNLRMLSNCFTKNAAAKFLSDLCEIQACGVVDAERMIQYIYQYDRDLKHKAFKKYNKYIKSKKYTHIVSDEDGNKIEKECTKYIAHAEKLR